MKYFCDKRLENGARQCHEPAGFFYASAAIGEIAARCEDHKVAAYKPELGELLILTEAEYEARLTKS